MRKKIGERRVDVILEFICAYLKQLAAAGYKYGDKQEFIYELFCECQERVPKSLFKRALRMIHPWRRTTYFVLYHDPETHDPMVKLREVDRRTRTKAQSEVPSPVRKKKRAKTVKLVATEQELRGETIAH